jgi:hypothetical protein
MLTLSDDKSAYGTLKGLLPQYRQMSGTYSTSAITTARARSTTHVPRVRLVATT